MHGGVPKDIAFLRSLIIRAVDELVYPENSVMVIITATQLYASVEWGNHI